MTTISLDAGNLAKIESFHQRFNRKSTFGGLSSAAATFLVIGALIVIGSSCLCATLPGVNILRDVFLPGILPGIVGVAFSIPFIVSSVIFDRHLSQIRKEKIDCIYGYLTGDAFRRLSKDEKVEFIVGNFLYANLAIDDFEALPEDEKANLNFLPINRSRAYRAKIVDELRARLPKDEKDADSDEKALIDALEEAKKRIYRSKDKNDDIVKSV